MSDTPRYRLDTRTFIAPQLLEKGTEILWDGEPGPHMVPVNEAATARMAEYLKANPNAAISPVEKLPLMMVVEPAPPPAPQPVDVTEGTKVVPPDSGDNPQPPSSKTEPSPAPDLKVK